MSGINNIKPEEWDKAFFNSAEKNMKGTVDESKYDVVMQDGVKVITAQFHNNCEHQLGTYMEDTAYDFVIEEDCDFYAPPDCDVNLMADCNKDCQNCFTEDNIIFKLRKGAFTEEEQLGAYEGLIGAAQPTQNRGVAAGPKTGKLNNRDWVTDEQIEIMDHFIRPTSSLFEDEDPIAEIIRKHRGKDQSSRGFVWLRNKITDAGYAYESFFESKIREWRGMPESMAKADARIIKETFVSDTSYANQVNSGLAGFFDRYPRIPYGRATSYTEKHFETYEKCYPFMRKLANKFSELLPRRFAYQNARAAELDPRFRVAGEDTPFTTITVNKNFRTAAHRDAGDLHEGFSNLTVVAKEKDWEGGYLVLPEFRVAINIRPGDLLLINNHGGIHGNTELLPPKGKTLEDMERISLVCYFRDKMSELGSWEYEAVRRQFVDDRMHNKEHPNQRPLWNGVSPGMWESQEWYDYLESKLGRKVVQQYHPNAYKIVSSLEEFF